MMHSKWDTGIGSLQWFIFLLANSLTIPIIVGQVFQFSPEEISGLMQRTFLVVGAASLLSGWLGHRLPIPDGPAGIWLGVFTLMGQMAVVQGVGKAGGSLQLLEGAMLLTGAFLIIVSFAGWMNKLLKLFTPLVNGVYLAILGFQLSGMFLKGMIGVSGTSSKIQPGIVILAFLIFIFVLALSVWGRGWLKSYAVLIGMAAGSIAFVLFFGSKPMPQVSSIVSLPDIFAWGVPQMDVGMFVSSIMVAFVLISSIIASISAMLQVFGEKAAFPSEKGGQLRGALKSSGIIGGINTILSSVFSAVGVVPFSVAAGFVRMTGQSRMLPFFLASITLAVISFFPKVYTLLAMLPVPVAYAAMLASFTSMAGIGISSVLKEPLDHRRLTILSTSLSLGTGVMFIPPEIFSALPTVLQYVLSNGVMVGMLVALVLEQIWRPIQAEAGLNHRDAPKAG